MRRNLEYERKYENKESTKTLRYNYQINVCKPRRTKLIQEKRQGRKCGYCQSTLIGRQRLWCSTKCHAYHNRTKKTGKIMKPLIKFEFCLECGKKNSKERWKFCSKECGFKYNYKKDSTKKKRHEAYLRTKEQRKIRRKEYYEESKEARLLKGKDWRKKNIIRVRINNNKRIKARKEKDIRFKIQLNLRRRLAYAIKRYSKTGKIMSSGKYGIDYNAIIEHLIPFPEDLSKYHIDHIKPLCSFDLTNSEEVKKAFAPENHQWLLAEENIKKSSRDLKISIWKKR